MTPADFAFFRRLLKERSGLALSDDKNYLLESRLLPVARRAGAHGLADLAQRMRGRDSEAIVIEVVEAMTTNETFFFRDKVPFTLLRESVLPSLLASRAAERRIRIWCAAASSGQEPYSIAMLLKEMGSRLAGWRIEILATDIATHMLERARIGRYSQFEVQRGLPIQSLVAHFTQVDTMWEIAPELRAMVEFRPLNLLQPFGHIGTFDIVFCRNVLLYFDAETKRVVLGRIARQMPDDGALLLGAAETVVGLSDAFRPDPERRGLNLRVPAAIGLGTVVPFRSAAVRPAGLA